MAVFKTPKGTELPLLDLRGKPYLQVPHRIVWFREEHVDWVIKTSFLRLDDQVAICIAEIFDESGKLKAMAHKREDQKHFADHMEKAETSAIGRALALIGYGTQFAPDLEEGERLADSPVQAVKIAKPKPIQVSDAKNEVIFDTSTMVPFGADKGKPISAIPIEELEKMVNWVQTKKIDKGEQITGSWQEFMKNASPYIERHKEIKK